jgi:hypothetical protein
LAILLFELNQLFMLLVPELVILVNGVGAIIFPSEPKALQNSLRLTKSKVVIVVTCPLMTDPLP